MARLYIDRKMTVWAREYVDFDETKYTEEEFVKLYHQQIVGAKYGDRDIVTSSLYETYDYEMILDTTEDISPEENGNQPTLEILNPDGETLYTNLENQE